MSMWPCAAANGGGPSRLQSARLVAAVAEFGSLGGMTRLLTVCLLAMVSCSHVTPVTERASTSRDFSMSLVATEPIISSGTVPSFRLTLTNISDHPCRILNVDRRRPDLQHNYYNL